MLKSVAISLTFVLANAATDLADASATEAAATKPVYWTAGKTFGVLLEDAAAKAIIDKHISGLTDNPSISMAAGITLKALQAMACDMITDEILNAVDSEFKALQSGK